MVFDPMKFYDDGQRRQKRYDSLVPVFVVALVLLVVFGAAFVAYQRSHVKPKPVSPAVILPKPVHDTEFTCPSEPNGTDEGCNTWRNQTTVTQSSTTWYRCADGVTVTGNLKNCPEYAGSGGTKILDVGHEPFTKDEFAYSKKAPRKHKRKAHEFISFTGYPSGTSNIESYNPHAHVTLQQLEYMQSHDQSCIVNVNGQCWVTLDSYPAPAPTDDVRLEVRPSTHPATEWSHETMLQYVFTKEQASRLGNEWIKQCGPDNHEQACYTPGKPYCLPGGSVKGDIPPCGDVQVGDGGDRHVMGTTESKPNCDDPAGEGFCPFRDMPEALSCCDGREPGLVISNKRQTTPQDITNLMEQIAPTAKQEKPKITQSYDGCNTTTYTDGQPTSTTTLYCSPKPPAPDCKMPADIDVCPQTLDPKAVSDKKGKP